MTQKERLDVLLVERGLALDQAQAERLIMAGEVRAGGVVADKPGQQVAVDTALHLRPHSPYVSRGGPKLAAALDDFQLDVKGLVAVDVGASTGGFTDCLLQRGAARVYAIDVGYGQLAWKLRKDPRVVPLERTNIRYLDHLPDGVLADLAVIDASFIGLGLVLPATLRLLRPVAQVVALIKPQFEASKAQVSQGGVVRDPTVYRQVIVNTAVLAKELGLGVAGLTVSPTPGPAGNIEFLCWLRRPPGPEYDIAIATQRVVAAAQSLQKKGN